MPTKLSLQGLSSRLRKRSQTPGQFQTNVNPPENQITSSSDEQDGTEVSKLRTRNGETNGRTSMNTPPKERPQNQTSALEKTVSRPQQDPATKATTEDHKWYATDVACDLRIKYGEKYYDPDIRVWVKWQQDSNDQFKDFDVAAKRYLSEKINANGTYLKAGRCYLMRRDGAQETEADNQALKHEQRWSEVLRFIVGKFYYENRGVKFRLILDWEYADLTVQKLDRYSYQTSVSKYMYKKLQVNCLRQKFLSDDDFKAIFTDATVRKLIDEDSSLHGNSTLCTELRRNGRPLNEEDFKKQVFRDGTRLLAVCTYVGLPLDCLYRLLAAGVTDEDIPLTKPDLGDEYSDLKWDNFVQYQGGFKPHLFLTGEDKSVHQEVALGVVVPVFFYEVIGHGGFGEVFKARIDASHHNFSLNRDGYFAVKRFFAYDERAQKDFNQEQTILTKLSKRPHPHIVLQLTSWAQDGRFYLLFPLAECNLRAHLRTVFPGFSKANVLWLLRQLFGLADAVEHIHVSKGLGAPQLSSLGVGVTRPHTGYHHDLKPENILVFPATATEGRVLKISDFGTAKLDWALSGSGVQGRSHKSPNVGFGDRAYCAPDYAIKGETSRPYDIWSLGCIFLEVLLWAFDEGGPKLDDFLEERYKEPADGISSTAAFWFRHNVNGKETVSLKTCVERKLASLQGTCKDRGVFEDLVRVTAHMLTIIPDERPTAPTIFSDLRAIVRQAEIDLAEDPEFYMKVPGLRSEASEVAAPATMPYRSLSRQHSIDSRSVEARYGDPDQLQPRFLSQGDHRRSISDPARRPRPTLLVATNTDTTFFGDHLTVTDTNGTSSNSRLVNGRPRSPSISITGPDNEPGEHEPMDNRPSDNTPGRVVVWRDTPPTRAEIPTLRHKSSGSSGSMTM